VYVSVQATAAVVAAHPSGIRPLVIGYSRIRVFDGAINFDRHDRGGPVHVLGPVVTSHHVGRDRDA